LLALAGLFEILTTALVIPLFDEVLIGEKAPKIALHKVGLFQQLMDFLNSYLHLIWGWSIITHLAIALVILTFLKGICLYYSNYAMSHVGQSVVTDLRTKLFGPFSTSL
jgi:hypothetical protein